MTYPPALDNFEHLTELAAKRLHRMRGVIGTRINVILGPGITKYAQLGLHMLREDNLIPTSKSEDHMPVLLNNNPVEETTYD